MVSTRRMESSGCGSAVDTVSHHSRTVGEGVDNSEACSSSESEPSQEEESWSSQCRSAKQIRERRETSPEFSGRVRELRNRFVCSDLSSYSRKLRRHRNVVGSRVYSRDMQNDSEDIFIAPEDSDEIFSPRKHSRHSRHRLRRSNGRIALSLRPLKNQCYADPHSSMTHSNSSGDEKPEGDSKFVRRSTRQRTLKYDTFNTSWITDAQMVRGYPNFRSDFLSDQDSRHSQENHHEQRNGMRSQSTRKPHVEIENSNRHNGEVSGRREIKKNMKYIYDYETTEVRTRRVSVRGQGDVQDGEDRNGKEAKKNGIEEDIVRSRSARTTGRNSEQDSETVDNDETLVNGDNEVKTDSKEDEAEKEDQESSENKNLRETRTKTQNQNKEEDVDTESDHEIRRLRKRRRSNLNYMDDPRFSPRKTRSRKITDSEKSSDSSDEDIRNHRYKYQLRQRKPKKPDPLSMEAPVRRSDRLLHGLCARRRRDRRRERDSSSDDSTFDDVEPARSRKVNKTPHNRHPTKTLNIDGQLKSGPVGNAPAPIEPETLDAKVRFASVGGLDNHVRCLREMVVLPMMYPEVFKQFQIQPPRGVLFHGPPGTGKTLIARALANECSFGSRKVSFFMRKGADLLSKWVGESEKQLRLLFEQAAQMKPSIIFFDEIDGLAPVRSSRQDQIHASIVSTLLALMDGLDNRGEVIVIGATNRIDAIDPALRRPGRFDRELFFPLPARKERESILRVVVSSWRVPPSSSVLSALAEHSSGYCGGDLRALATEAVIHALSRVYPQVYTAPHRLHIDPTRVQVEKVDLWRAWSVLVPAAQRVSPGPARRLCPLLEPLLRPPLTRILALFQNTFPHGIHPALANIKVCGSMQAAVLLVTGEGPAQGQSAHLAPALLHHMEHVTTYTLELAHLYRQSERTPEEACVEVFNEARRNVPSVVYVPSIEQWWSLVGETVRAIFLSQLTQLDPSIPILLLATANVEYKYLPEQISSIFSTYRKEVLHLSPPVTSQREAFFKPLIISACLKAPKAPKRRPKTPPPLPRAPTPPPEPIDQNKLQKIYEKEEETLRELRIFLRDICKKLASNKAFYMFTKPVDLEEVPDYLTIIKQPMDLETMMTKVDLHRYSSAQEFLADIDLICMNALEYNPAKTTADKQIRHRACSLRDYAYSLIKAEMDSDFEEQCRDISRKRKERKASVTEFLPPFIHTVPNQGEGEVEVEGEVDEQAVGDATKQVSGVVDSDTGARIGSPQRKRKMTPLWARGYLSTRKRRRANTNNKTPPAHTHAHHAADTEVCILESVEKIFSGDESKENKPGEENKPTVCVLDSTFMGIDATTLDVHTPLSVNCDLDSTVKSLDTSPLGLNTSKQSKLNETLSPAIWPSFADLLEDSPQIDDGEADEANENQSLEQRKVIIDVSELDHVLSHAVSVTQGCSVLALMDLYGQLNKLVSQYSRTHERKTLPQELTREISRFQENQKKPSRCSTPPS